MYPSKWSLGRILRIALSVVVVLVAWPLVHGPVRRILNKQKTVDLPAHGNYQGYGASLIWPYQFAVAESADGKRTLYKQRSEDNFGLSVLEGDKVVGQIELEYSPWEISWNPAGTAVSFFIESPEQPGTYIPTGWRLNRNQIFRVSGPTTDRAAYPLKWSPDGRHIAYIATQHNEASLVIAELQDEHLSRIDQVLPGVDPEAGLAWSADSQHLVFGVQQDEKFLVQDLDLHTGATENLADLGNSKVRDLSWAPSQRQIVAGLRDGEDEYFRLLSLAPNKTSHVCGQEVGDVVTPVMDDKSRKTIFILEKDATQKVVSEEDCRKPIDIAQPSSGAVRFQNDGYSRSRTSLIEEQADGPPLLKHMFGPGAEVKEAAIKSVRQEWLHAGDRSVPVWVWEARDGLSSDRAVIMIHGGPLLHETGAWDPLREAFLQRSYIVTAPNYPGSTGYGQQYEDRHDLDAQADAVIAARQYLVNDKGIKPGRIIVIASSYGTRVLLRAMRKAPELCGTVVFSPFLAARSDVAQPISFQGTVLAFHGERDRISPAASALSSLQHLFSENQRDGRFYWHTFKDEGHGLIRISSLQTEFGAIDCLSGLKQCSQR